MNKIDLTAFEQYFTREQTPQQLADELVTIICDYSRFVMLHSELADLEHARHIDTLQMLYDACRAT